MIRYTLILGLLLGGGAGVLTWYALSQEPGPRKPSEAVARMHTTAVPQMPHTAAVRAPERKPSLKPAVMTMIPGAESVPLVPATSLPVGEPQARPIPPAYTLPPDVPPGPPPVAEVPPPSPVSPRVPTAPQAVPVEPSHVTPVPPSPSPLEPPSFPATPPAPSSSPLQGVPAELPTGVSPLRGVPIERRVGKNSQPEENIANMSIAELEAKADELKRLALWKAMRNACPKEDQGDILAYAENAALNQLCFWSNGKVLVYDRSTDRVEQRTFQKGIGHINRITFEKSRPSDSATFVLWSNGRKEMTFGAGE